MKIPRLLIKCFLILLLVVVIANIVSAIAGFYELWMGLVTIGLFVILFVLVFRKNDSIIAKVSIRLVPVIFLLVVLYFSLLPLGYDQYYSMNVSRDGSIHSSSSRFYLEDANGEVVNNISNLYSLGYVNLVFKPRIFSGHVNTSFVIDGAGTYFATSNFSGLNSKGDYFWSFKKNIPSQLWGSARFDGNRECAYFDSSLNQTLTYQDSKDMFESGSFIVYANWMPEYTGNNNQQIIGHYNWELIQNNNSVKFIIWSWNGKDVSAYSIYYGVDKSFFNKTHEATAIYFADKKLSTGYIELRVDNNFAGRVPIGNQVVLVENGENSLTFGLSFHKNSSYFNGCIYQAGFDYTNIFSGYSNGTNFQLGDEVVKVPVVGNGNLNSINLVVKNNK